MRAFTTYKTESSNLYNKISGMLSKKGILIRMENLIMPGLPDCLLIYNRKTIFIELKIMRAGKISMPKFQYSMAVAMVSHIDPMHHWYFVYEEDGLGNEVIGAYKCTDIIHIAPEHDDRAVKLDIRSATPTMVFTKAENLLGWLALINKGTTK